MDAVFLILFLLSPVLLIVGLMKPSIFGRFFQETPSRKKLSLIFIGATILSFILFGITTDLSNSEGQVKVEEEKQEVESATTSPSVEPSPSPEAEGETTEIASTPTPKLKVFSTPTPTPATSSTYSCNCSKTCTQITSCEEAYYQLSICGCNIRDGDNDGVPCENLCPGG